MQSTRLPARAVRKLSDTALDTGRLVLLLIVLSIAQVVSFLLVVLAYGAIFVTGGTASPFEAFDASGRSVTHITASFSEPQFAFYFLSVYSALSMGAVGYWLYERLVFNVGQ